MQLKFTENVTYCDNMHKQRSPVLMYLAFMLHVVLQQMLCKLHWILHYKSTVQTHAGALPCPHLYHPHCDHDYHHCYEILQYIEFFTFAGLMFLFSFALMAVAYRSLFLLSIYFKGEFRVDSLHCFYDWA